MTNLWSVDEEPLPKVKQDKDWYMTLKRSHSPYMPWNDSPLEQNISIQFNYVIWKNKYLRFEPKIKIYDSCDPINAYFHGRNSWWHCKNPTCTRKEMNYEKYVKIWLDKVINSDINRNSDMQKSWHWVGLLQWKKWQDENISIISPCRHVNLIRDKTTNGGKSPERPRRRSSTVNLTIEIVNLWLRKPRRNNNTQGRESNLIIKQGAGVTFVNNK